MAKNISTFFMFLGQAEEAMNLYMSAFDNSEITSIAKYGPDGPGAEGTVMRADFTLNGKEYICIDSPAVHEFSFTPSMSLFVECEDNAEIDKLCEKLSQGGEYLMPPDNYGFSTKFAWLNDKFGVSWQLNLA